ncbi:solute carrier family 35 member C2-like isoform X2 [Hylaeus volcanicus]|uniref:solute carrier family 35 member C2-like isoform X2 n=1 Tax=Hylaeus volcanicus TaxID=313075 RepID=UPI0023B77B9F|nr:solute carrier family 35 member C2-like isoform X2 [Hylaeus volcanicus]
MISTKENVKQSKHDKDPFIILLKKNIISYLTIPVNLNKNLKLYCFFSYHTLEILISILFWYCNSIGITALNKYLFDVAGFNLPLLVAFVHFSCVSIGLIVFFFFFPSYDEDSSLYNLISSATWSKLIPIGVLAALDVSLSNLSYAEVSISVITIVKSSSIVITYLLSVAMKLEKFSYRFFSAVTLTFLSICLTVNSMVVKRKIGVIYLFGAVLAGGCRWVLVHEQLQPVCAVALALPCFYIDVVQLTGFRSAKILVYNSSYIFVLIFFSSCLGFFLLISEYYIVMLTSSLTLTIAGVGKEVCTIFMSILLFNESISIKSFVGILASISCILFYTYLRSTSPDYTLLHSVDSGNLSSFEELRVSCSTEEKILVQPFNVVSTL